MITDVDKDPAAARMTVTAEFDAPVERVWQVWADPRQLERWWGPPTWPATVTEHDLAQGGTVKYVMTGPDGGRSAGYWNVIAVDPPNGFEIEDGFAGDDGEPNADMPTTMMRVALARRDDGGTRMTVVSTFPSTEAMEQMVAMGMEEGMRAAMGQIDALLLASAG
jgi:uncharacterized protein YndB with AHSA1/START domain